MSTSLNPESEGAPKRAKPISSSSSSSSPRRHKRVKKTITEVRTEPLVRCPKLKFEEYADKSLYICSFEEYEPAYVSPSRPEGRREPWDGCYAVRAINLRDLLTSSERLTLRERASVTDKDLSFTTGCGVFGSKIVFAGGMKPNFDPNRIGPRFGPDKTTDAYAFDIHDPERGIVKMAGALNGGKYHPPVFEFGGKLFALSQKDVWSFDDIVSFEVFDPEQGTWSVLPIFPDHDQGLDCYAIVGTKLFTFSLKTKSSIWCFELAAQDPKWRRVTSMRSPFPFTGQALVVVDMPQPEHSNSKLLFCVEPADYYWTKLLVHFMSTDENHQESLIEIVEMTLPAELIPRDPEVCHLFHPGGNLVCLVTTRVRMSTKKPRGFYTVRGAVLPIQFEFDISKVHTDRKNCFTVQFHSPRKFKYHSGPDCIGTPSTLGCFVL